ncbi:mycofactocin precursor MftA [Dermatobacter hominis]|nr:mycofactocin precursor MftA [Dermatobacter hominis]UDY37778.1 mycofactocin precursor MftA [Dermatobacter hominis]
MDTATTTEPTAETELPVVDDAAPADEAVLVADELLVEEVSIDGMCGVY